ncbi:hypothetical protein QCA50_014942 [Cerrena zonata]|uniref:Aldehyde dehydrogenase domain-containing protein n=1 Tax=Cerrena zonata TaxID=2478898 RepID=A0AAW0FSE9_9APHY
MSSQTQTTISPHNQSPYIVRTYPSEKVIESTIKVAKDAQKQWAKVPLKERIAIGHKFIEEFKKAADTVPKELAWSMGRPISQGAGEVRGFLDRAEYLLSIAESSLSDVSLADTDKPGFKRYIKRTPLGVILIIAPWNYPYLVSINAVLPAILAGNAVLLKPSPQTPEAAERIASALIAAGVPDKIVQWTLFHLPAVSLGGKSVRKAAVDAEGFKGVALELGGKDPAYVRPDADLDYTVGELVDGALFNSGQSCCSIERIYVHEDVYDAFVPKFVELVKKYKLGDPTSTETNLGPVVSLASAQRIRKQVSDAIKAGAKPLIPESLFPIAAA